MTEQIEIQDKQTSTTSADVLALVSDKWVVDVLHAIRADLNRYSLMQRHIPEISRKMLTQTLRKLERNGIIQRVDYDEQPPRVEYFITSLGESLISHLTGLCQWSKSRFEEVEQAREQYDNNNENWI